MKTKNFIKSIFATFVLTFTLTTNIFSQCLFLEENYSDYNGSHLSCHGMNDGSITVTPIGAFGNVTYLWSTGETTQTISDLFSGFYQVTATDNSGCLVTKTFQIVEPQTIQFSTSILANTYGYNLKCYGENNGKATVLAIGGTGKLEYLWSDGVYYNRHDSLSAGTYTISVTDENSCVAIQTITITQPSEVQTIGVIVSDVTGAETNDGSLRIDVIGGVGNYSYFWQDGQTTQTATGLEAGNHIVIAQDEFGCGKRTLLQLQAPNIIQTNSTSTTIGSRNTRSLSIGSTNQLRILNSDIKNSPLTIKNIENFTNNYLMIHDLMGNTIVRINNYSNQFYSEIQNLRTGYYVVTIQYVDGEELKTFSDKIVVVN